MDLFAIFYHSELFAEENDLLHTYLIHGMKKKTIPTNAAAVIEKNM